MADDKLANFRQLYRETAPAQEPRAGSGPRTELQSKTESAKDALSELAVKAASERRIDIARLTLAGAIMFAYVASIFVALIWFGTRIPGVSPAGKGPLTLDPYSSAMVDILKVLVLPVVTLMLGFYFGTGSTPRSPGVK
jgi:hypothetical protein